MSITRASTLAQVAAEVSRALKSAGVNAVLTGGACATIYSGGEYQSDDLDLIPQDAFSQRTLDDAMATIGFVRNHDHYDHPKTDFFVEFPRGPLSIGSDVNIRPVQLRVGKTMVTALSPTDSCRDRLAAFFHWNDRQSLDAAVAIAIRNRVNLKKLREWAEEEKSLDRLDEFLRELSMARRASRSRKAMRRAL